MHGHDCILPDDHKLFGLSQHCHTFQSTASNLSLWCTNSNQKYPSNCLFQGYPVRDKKFKLPTMTIAMIIKNYFIIIIIITIFTRLPTWRFLEESGDLLRDLNVTKKGANSMRIHICFNESAQSTKTFEDLCIQSFNNIKTLTLLSHTTPYLLCL